MKGTRTSSQKGSSHEEINANFSLHPQEGLEATTGAERSLPDGDVRTSQQDLRDTGRPQEGKGKRREEQGNQTVLGVWPGRGKL